MSNAAQHYLTDEARCVRRQRRVIVAIFAVLWAAGIAALVLLIVSMTERGLYVPPWLAGSAAGFITLFSWIATPSTRDVVCCFDPFRDNGSDGSRRNLGDREFRHSAPQLTRCKRLYGLANADRRFRIKPALHQLLVPLQRQAGELCFQHRQKVSLAMRLHIGGVRAKE